MAMSSKPAGAESAPEITKSRMVVGTVTGSHVLTIDRFSESKAVVNSQFIRSGSFLAAGYCWCIFYYPNGINWQYLDWISLYLELVPTCTPDVKARFTFSLLNDNGDAMLSSSSNDYGKFNHMNKRTGVPTFIKRKDLEKSAHLRDDCFRIRCDITVLKVTHKEDISMNGRFFIVPPSDMDKNLECLLASGKGADITFVVSGEIFIAHRNILAARSPVFMAEFFGPMSETMTRAKIDDMEALLNFIYTDMLPAIEDGETMVMLEHLLVSADRYGLERLKLICEDKLCNYIDTSSVGTILALAEQHGCDGLKKACFEFLISGNNLKRQPWGPTDLSICQIAAQPSSWSCSQRSLCDLFISV